MKLEEIVAWAEQLLSDRRPFQAQDDQWLVVGGDRSSWNGKLASRSLAVFDTRARPFGTMAAVLGSCSGVASVGSVGASIHSVNVSARSGNGALVPGGPRKNVVMRALRSPERTRSSRPHEREGGEKMRQTAPQ